MTIAILNYNVGNLASIANMLKKIGITALITNNQNEIKSSSHLILPGVGHFDHCIEMFHRSGLRDIVSESVFEHQKPILGICVGHQMLFQKSEEGKLPGLGWIEGEVIAFSRAQLPESYKVPHMGWCDVNVKNNNILFKDIDNPRFYMVHSYYVRCEDSFIVATANYGYEFVSAVNQNNIFGTQFHPEKSHKFGMKLFKNFSLT